ncbi:hypothetical protein BVY02_01040, partial [bacterium J17]
LRAENKTLKSSIAQLEQDIEEMPLKEQELKKINRDYETTQASYQRLLAARENADLQNSLVRNQQGAQFKIVESPERPAEPAGPNRMLIFGLGIAVSIGLLMAIPMALFFLNDSYKFRSDFEYSTGVPVLSVVPPMPTREAQRASMQANRLSVIASSVSFVCGALVIFLVV